MSSQEENSQRRVEGYEVDKRVVGEIIKKALGEVEGIHAVKRSLFGEGIKIEFLKEGIGISLELIIKEGNAIPQLVEETQKKVKQEVQRVLEKPLLEVNIGIKGIKYTSPRRRLR